MNAEEILARCQQLGVLVTCGKQAGTLLVSPSDRLPEALGREIEKHARAVFALVKDQPRRPTRRCGHCDGFAELDDTYHDADRTFMLWRCHPCNRWGVTHGWLRHPPIWFQKAEVSC